MLAFAPHIMTSCQGDNLGSGCGAPADWARYPPAVARSCPLAKCMNHEDVRAFRFALPPRIPCKAANSSLGVVLMLREKYKATTNASEPNLVGLVSENSLVQNL